MNELLSVLGMSVMELYLWCAVVVLLILFFVFLAVVLRQKKRVNALDERIDRFCRGADGASLENDILDMFDENAEIRERLDKTDKKIRNIYWRLKSTIQKVGVIKYDAFANMGGTLSYAIALLDENNNGMILNCVHSVDSCYTYTKIVTDGRADVELGAEEANALKMALDNFHPDGALETENTEVRAKPQTSAGRNAD